MEGGSPDTVLMVCDHGLGALNDPVRRPDVGYVPDRSTSAVIDRIRSGGTHHPPQPGHGHAPVETGPWPTGSGAMNAVP
jgi:hypothetical protein